LLPQTRTVSLLPGQQVVSRVALSALRQGANRSNGPYFAQVAVTLREVPGAAVTTLLVNDLARETAPADPLTVKNGNVFFNTTNHGVNQISVHPVSH
jgi:hypothetical protein